MIQLITKQNLEDAAKAYTVSWKESHKAICSQAFIEKHTVEYQTDFLNEKLNSGWELYANYQNGLAVGMVGLNFQTGEIGLLYILPEEWGKGYGRQLLDFSVAQMLPKKPPFLTVLNTNKRAVKIYEKYGFTYSGEETVLSKEKNISELKYLYQSV